MARHTAQSNMSLENVQPMEAREDDGDSLAAMHGSDTDVRELLARLGQGPDVEGGDDAFRVREPLRSGPLDAGVPCGGPGESGYQGGNRLEAQGAALPPSGLVIGLSESNIEQAASAALPQGGPGNQEPSAEQAAPLRGGHEPGYRDPNIEQAPEGTIGVKCSLDLDSRVYYCYGEFAHVRIVLCGLPCATQHVAVFAYGDYKRGNEVAGEQSLHWTKNGQIFILNEASDSGIFKVPTAGTREACSVHGRSDELYIDLVLDRTQVKLFNSKDCAVHPGRDNTFSLLVACTFADGSSQTIEIQPRMRVLSKQSPKKRKRDLPEEFTRPYKAFRAIFENLRASSR